MGSQGPAAPTDRLCLGVGHRWSNFATYSLQKAQEFALWSCLPGWLASFITASSALFPGKRSTCLRIPPPQMKTIKWALKPLRSIPLWKPHCLSVFRCDSSAYLFIAFMHYSIRSPTFKKIPKYFTIIKAVWRALKKIKNCCKRVPSKRLPLGDVRLKCDRIGRL